MTTAIGAYATASALKTRLSITDSTDDSSLTALCDQVNSTIERLAQRVLAPVTSATYLLDGTGCDRFEFARGIRAISALTVGEYTGATKVALASTDYFLRPAAHDRIPGFPATIVVLSDLGSRRTFPLGFDTISMTATTGFDAIPDDVTDIALTVATRAWHAIQAGQSDIVGTDEMGRPLVSRAWLGTQLDAIRRTYGLTIP